MMGQQEIEERERLRADLQEEIEEHDRLRDKLRELGVLVQDYRDLGRMRPTQVQHRRPRRFHGRPGHGGSHRRPYRDRG